MKRSTKTISIIFLFFLIITIVIVGRSMIGNHFKKKFSKRPPPGIIVTEVIEKEFSEKIKTLDKNNLDIEKNMKSTMSSIYKSVLLAKEDDNDLIYFVEDDYIHERESLIEMLLTYEKLSSLFKNEIFL